MSSVEQSDQDDDSLSKELEYVMQGKTNKLHKHGARSSRNSNPEKEQYDEAFKLYVFKSFDRASEKCMFMIASNPTNPLPYDLMAKMHEEVAEKNEDENQLAKAADYFFLNAFYSPPSEEKWLKVANLSNSLKLYNQAAYCFGRALKMNKMNLQILLKRAECLQMCSQIKKAANIYKKIIEKISNSPEISKKYAKLLFKREQYSKVREVLSSLPQFHQDRHIKFMIAQTYQNQKKYQQLYYFIKTQIIDQINEANQNIFNELQPQFLQMLFICKANCPNLQSNLRMKDLIDYMQREYDIESADYYQQMISHTKKSNPEVTFQLLFFLIQYEPHQTIQNYLYCSEYLGSKGKNKQAITLLQNALTNYKNKRSIQLKAQLNYFKSLVKNKGPLSVRISKNNGRHVKPDHQDIFYSDDEGEQQDNNNVRKQRYSEDERSESNQIDNLSKNKVRKSKRIKKNNNQAHMEVKDPQILNKLIQNNCQTLLSIRKQVQQIKKTTNLSKNHKILDQSFSKVKDCLEYLIQIRDNRQQNNNNNKQLNLKKNQSIINNRHLKRRRNILGKSSRKNNNLILNNCDFLLKSLKSTTFFMKQLIELNQNSQVIQLAQMLSKAHFFKWQNRISQFRYLKKQIYQMGTLSCLSLEKYSKSIFFLRYLINKHPQNQFYLFLAQKVMKLSAGKLFINSLAKKGREWRSQSHQMSAKNNENFLKMYYLAGLQYMQNYYFELAIGMFTKVVSILQTKQQFPNQNQQSQFVDKPDPQKQIPQTQTLNKQNQQMLSATYLCMCACFLQMSSSRTVFNKLQQINRSAFCFAKYQKYSKQNKQIQYNIGRWFTYIKYYPKAISILQRLLEQNNKNVNKSKSQQQYQRAALILIVLYRETEQYQKAKLAAQLYYG